MEHKLTQWYLDLPKIVKILLALIPLFGGVIRILKYVENKNTNTLIFGIIWAVVGSVGSISFIFPIAACVIDIISVCKNDDYAILA